MQKIIINKLGPIDHAELDCTKWIVFIGAQSTGKSTVAKAIFFFRKVGESILDLVRQRLRFLSDSDADNFSQVLAKLLQERFLDIFGSYLAVSKDTSAHFYYEKETHIKISLSAEMAINVEFSENILQYLSKFDADVSSEKTTPDVFETDILEKFRNSLFFESQALQKLFVAKYTDVYLPAGRSMVAVLADQLDYITFTMNDAQKSMMDFCTRCYVENVLALRPRFKRGLDFDNWVQMKNDEQILAMAKKMIYQILKAVYIYDSGNDYLILPDGQRINLSRASSGQQEVLWITNLLFYHLFYGNKSAFIIEEPESNLYPETQKLLIDLIALTANQGNNIIITTHSPYILGSINNLLYAGQFAKATAETKTAAANIIDKDFWVDISDLSAWHLKDGKITNCIDDEIGLIDNGLIDEISRVINGQFDDLLYLKVGAE